MVEEGRVLSELKEKEQFDNFKEEKLDNLGSLKSEKQ
jgi:hypothetical protein